MFELRNKHTEILTLFWPFGGLIYSITNWKKPGINNIIWLYCFFL